MRKKIKIPAIKKDILSFLNDEEGKITKKDALKLGVSVVMMGLIVGRTAGAHDNCWQQDHSSHSNAGCSADNSSNFGANCGGDGGCSANYSSESCPTYYSAEGCETDFNGNLAAVYDGFQEYCPVDNCPNEYNYVFNADFCHTEGCQDYYPYCNGNFNSFECAIDHFGDNTSDCPLVNSNDFGGVNAAECPSDCTWDCDNDNSSYCPSDCSQDRSSDFTANFGPGYCGINYTPDYADGCWWF